MTALATPIVTRADQRQCMSIADLPHEALSRYDPRRLLRCIPICCMKEALLVHIASKLICSLPIVGHMDG